MHIRHSISIEASLPVAMEAARAWVRDELQPLDDLPHMALGEIVEGNTPDGAQSLSTQIDQDGIIITTTVSAIEVGTSCKMTMDLRTEGDGFSAKLRNLTLLPGRKLLTKQVQSSLLQIQQRASSG